MAERDISLDNCKGWLITLVILGHAFEIGGGLNDWFTIRWQAVLYTFHMPLFVAITGYLSNVSSDNYIKNIFNLFLVYIIFQTISCILSDEVSFLTPFFALWYIVSAVWWRISVIIFSNFRISNIALLVLSLMFCLFGGVIPLGTFLAFDRTMNFFPFFIIGYIFRKNDTYNIKYVYDRIPWILSFLVFVLICFWVLFNRTQDELLSRISLGHLSFSIDLFHEPKLLYAFLVKKLEWIVITCLCSLSIYKILPQVRFFIKEGKYTIDYYLYHPFLLFAIWKVLQKFDIQYSNIISMIVFIVCITAIYFIKQFKLFYYLSNPFKLLELIKK